MIGWLAPYALYGLALLAVPVAIHLLRTQRARRIAFPTLRFVRAARSRAARPRLPSDPWLLLVRLALVAAIVTALARPVFLFPSRVAAWNARLSRALVMTDAGGPEVAAAVAAEEATAYATRQIRADHLRDGLVRAASWLAASPPSRREIVVVAPVPLGEIDPASLALLPADIGVRFVSIGTGSPREGQGSGGRLLGAAGIAPPEAHWQLEGPATAVSYRVSAAGATSDGLSLVGSADAGEELTRLRRAVASAGAPAPDPKQPLVVRFRGAPPAAGAARIKERWMIETVLRLSETPDLQRVLQEGDDGPAQAGSDAAAAPEGASWWPVIDAGGEGIGVRAAAGGASLIIEVAAPPESFAAAVALRAALAARRGDMRAVGREVERVPPAQLAEWSRPPAAVDASAWTRAESGDARWVWLLAAVLLAAEQAIRRPRSPARDEEARAA